MTDNLRESLSALIDGEASEVEVHRLLRQMDADSGLVPSWVSYQQVRAVVRGENVLSVEEHLSLHQRISLAIEDEASHAELPSINPGVPTKRYVVPAAGLAVAASLVVAIFVGFTRQSTEGVPGSELVDVNPPQVINAQPVANNDNLLESQPEAFNTDELRELDAEKQRLLRAYLNQHDRMARMNPNVRTAGFDKAQGK